MEKSGRGMGELKKQSLEETQLVGDPRFIDGILRCVKQRSELLGLEAAMKADVNLNTLNNSQLDDIIQGIINKANQNEYEPERKD